VRVGTRLGHSESASAILDSTSVTNPPAHGERPAARDKRRARRRAIGEGDGRIRKELESLDGRWEKGANPA